MELEDPPHTKEQLEKAKTLIRSIDNLELKGATDMDVEDVKGFGNLIIEHGGFIDHAFNGPLKKLYSNGYAPSQITEDHMFIKPIEGQKQSNGVRQDVKKAVEKGEYTVKTVKQDGTAVIDYNQNL